MTLSTRCATLGLGGLLLFVVSTLPASASPIFIVGNSTGSLATATANSFFDAATNTLTLTLFNTSPFDARITGLGYDLPPDGNASASGLNGFTGSVDFQPAGVDFGFSDAALGNVPAFVTAVLDFGFITGGNFAGGNPPEGLPPGVDPGDQAVFFISGGANFAGFSEQQISESIFVRFQRVGSAGEGSDVGVPVPAVIPIPEPGTMSLVGVGLVAAWRRRQKLRRFSAKNI